MIHSYSVDILKTVGIAVQSEEARSIFEYNGAKIDGMQVYLDEKVIEKYLSCVPSSFSIQNADYNVEVGKGNLCAIPTYGAVKVSYNGKVRSSTRKDFINFSKLNHMSKHIDMSCPYILEPNDIPLEYKSIYKIAMSVKYSNKPTISISNNKNTAKNSIHFIKNFFDNKKDYILLGNVNLSSPLILGCDTSDVIRVHGEENQPLMIGTSGLSGLTSPPTLASNFLLNNAATIAGIVFSQMVSPGLPVVYALPLFGMDSFNMHAAVGHPSTALFTMATAEMGRYYNIPVRSGGTYTDSNILDYQSGYESFINLFSTLFSKTDLLMHTFGMEDSLNTVSYNKYIVDEALFNNTITYLNGFEINEHTLMMDEIKKAGSTGNYININNLRLMSKEYPSYSFHFQSFEHLIDETSKIVNDRIDSYKPLPLDKYQQKLLQSILPTKYID